MEKENNDKGELIYCTAWFTKLNTSVVCFQYKLMEPCWTGRILVFGCLKHISHEFGIHSISFVHSRERWKIFWIGYNLTHWGLSGDFHFMVKGIKNFTSYGVIQAKWVKNCIFTPDFTRFYPQPQ